MLTSLALIFLVGLALAALCQKLKLPRIIGMLATGILLGPCVLNVLDGSILSISADLRKLALVIILLKAGLSLDLGDLKKVGRPAILMSCLPATCEIIGYVMLAPCFLGVTRVEAAVMGAVLAAVSPSRYILTMSCTALGAIFESTEITPFAPSDMNAVIWSSFPLYIVSSSPQSFTVCASAEMSPFASFAATIFLCFESS